MTISYNSEGASLAPVLSGTFEVGKTVKAAFPPNVIGTLQFTRAPVNDPLTKTPIADATANAVNSLSYLIQMADVGYSIGIDGSNQISKTIGPVVPVPPPPAPTIGTAKSINAAIVLYGSLNGDGGSPVTRYRGVLDNGVTAESDTLPVIFYAQPAGAARTGRLMAKNKNGWSDPSQESNAVTPAADIISVFDVVPGVAPYATRATLTDFKRTSLLVKNASTYLLQTAVRDDSNVQADQPTTAWTDLPANTENVITETGKLYLRGKNIAITAISWANGVVTVTSPSHGRTSGDGVNTVNHVPTGYNGTQPIITVIDANTFTFPLATDPGVATTLGSWVGRALTGVTVKIQVTK